jgi:hypothetical protein
MLQRGAGVHRKKNTNKVKQVEQIFVSATSAPWRQLRSTDVFIIIRVFSPL